MSEVTIAKFEEHLAQLRSDKDKLAALQRLLTNKDFKSIILDYFCVTECARYVGVSVDSSVGDREQADARECAKAGPQLKRWLLLQERILQNNANSIAETEEQLEMIRAEEAGE